MTSLQIYGVALLWGVVMLIGGIAYDSGDYRVLRVGRWILRAGVAGFLLAATVLGLVLALSDGVAVTQRFAETATKCGNEGLDTHNK